MPTITLSFPIGKKMLASARKRPGPLSWANVVSTSIPEARLFAGPPSRGMQWQAQNEFPAEAMETTGGITLLTSMGVAMPPALAQRVNRVKYRASVHCHLSTSNNGESCLIEVRGTSSDGSAVEEWNGWQWYGVKAFQPTRNDTRVVVHDRSDLIEVVSLLRSLTSRRDANGRLCLKVTKTFAAHFAAWLRTVPSHIEVELKGDLASLANAAVSGSVRLQADSVDIDWFDLTVIVDVSDTDLSPQEVKMLLNAKGDYVRLPEKGWRRLAFAISDDEQNQLARLGLSASEFSAAPQRFHALQLDAAAAHALLPTAQAAHIAKRVADIKTRVTPKVPSTIKATLRPYQLDGFHFLAYLSSNQFGGILADDMGLGKTLQALTWIAWLLQTNKPTKKTLVKTPCLVVCPKSVSDNWLAESKKFAPSLRVRAWRKSDSEDLAAGETPRAERQSPAVIDVLVINYAQLRLHGPALTKISWLAVILDEGQYIKNPASQTTEFARALQAKHRLILSGTPIENRLLDLWSLLSFAMPGVLGSKSNFGKLFNDKTDANARQRLSARVRPFLLRRTKKQVAADLPARIEEDLFCEIDGPQQIMYRAELKRAQQMLLKIKTQKELAKQTFHVLTAMLRLRQICCHPSLVHKDNQESGAKLEALLELLEPLMEQGRKVLVFSQFVEALQLIKPALVERTWPVWYLAGDTENRGALVDDFQTTPGGGVFLISLKAGSFGLNLTAASYVVLFDPWWNPAVENQAIDRTHRIGQTEPVVAYRLLIKDSIEQKIRDLQKRKGAVAEDVLGEEKFASMLTLDDLRGLFAD